MRKYYLRNRSRIYSGILLLISLLYWSCAGTKSSESIFNKADYPLTKQIAYSLTSSLEVRIPKGWFTSEDNECSCIDLWLIRDDFSATINLISLSADTMNNEDPESEISRILMISKDKRVQGLKNKFLQTKEDEIFVLNKRFYGAYEFNGDEGQPIRVVVFRYKNNYFELSAMPAHEVGKGAVNTQELFAVQQSVLTSIR